MITRCWIGRARSCSGSNWRKHAKIFAKPWTPVAVAAHRASAARPQPLHNRVTRKHFTATQRTCANRSKPFCVPMFQRIVDNPAEGCIQRSWVRLTLRHHPYPRFRDRSVLPEIWGDEAASPQDD